MAGKTRKAGRVKVYKIHDNGGRPFEVIASGKTVTVMKNMDTFEKVDGKFIDIKNPPKKLFNINVADILVGKKSPTGGYDGLKPSQAEGNSILLHINGNKYRYIGSKIYDFTTSGDKIIKYYSNVGHSDVPYPYAIGEKYIYIMLDAVMVPIELFDMKGDIYDQYYKDINGDIQKNIIKMKTKIIQKREF
jgi:hypothetical protein